jgi:hypothetical protein
MIGKILCKLGVHHFYIMKLVDSRGRPVNFCRNCKRKGCMVEQTLQRTKEYTPGEYVWTDDNINHDRTKNSRRLRNQ